MTVAQARALRELLERYRIPMSEEPLEWSMPFGRAAPLALEIGFGMGHALLETAQRHPDWNCVGVEVYRPGIGALLNAVAAAELTNVRVIEGDAMLAAGAMLTPGKTIAHRQLWAGRPAKYMRDLSDEAVTGMRTGVEHYVHNAKAHMGAVKAI